MSIQKIPFDTTFHFAEAGNLISQRIEYIDDDIQTIDGKIADLGNIICNNCDSIIQSGYDVFNENKDMYISRKNEHEYVKTEIENIQTMSESDKDILYQFYVISMEPKITYSMRLLDNAPDMIPYMSNVLSEMLSESNTQLLSETICMMYPITPNVYSTMSVYSSVFSD